jgi:hypothetical protein
VRHWSALVVQILGDPQQRFVTLDTEDSYESLFTSLTQWTELAHFIQPKPFSTQSTLDFGDPMVP